MELSMKDIWQEICFILSEGKNPSIPETIYEQKVLRVLEKLGWSQFKEEIKIRPKLAIGRQNYIEPDIVIYGQNKEPVIVFEIKRPAEIMSNFYNQLKSYMRQLKSDIGVLIGNEINVYYDGGLILKPCAEKKHFQLKFTVSGVLPVMMFVKAGKSGIKEMTSLQRIHASISER